MPTFFKLKDGLGNDVIQLKTSVNRVHGRCISVKVVNVTIMLNVNVVFGVNFVVVGANTVVFAVVPVGFVSIQTFKVWGL